MNPLGRGNLSMYAPRPKDRIIYDGLLAPYSLSFGPNIRSSLQDAYRDAREREGIITNLLPEVQSPDQILSGIEKRNALIVTAFRKDLARGTMRVDTMENHIETVSRFARWLLGQEPPHGLLDMTGGELQRYLDEANETINRVSFERFVRFLYNTGRIGYERHEDLADLLGM